MKIWIQEPKAERDDNDICFFFYLGKTAFLRKGREQNWGFHNADHIFFMKLHTCSFAWKFLADKLLKWPLSPAQTVSGRKLAPLSVNLDDFHYNCPLMCTLKWMLMYSSFSWHASFVIYTYKHVTGVAQLCSHKEDVQSLAYLHWAKTLHISECF